MLKNIGLLDLQMDNIHEMWKYWTVDILLQFFASFVHCAYDQLEFDNYAVLIEDEKRTNDWMAKIDNTGKVWQNSLFHYLQHIMEQVW